MNNDISPQQDPNASPASVSTVNFHPQKARGKTALTILLVLLFAILAGGGVYIWQHNKVTDLNTQLSTKHTAVAVAKVQPSDPDLAKATTLVNEFYVAYNQNVESDSASDDLIAKYGTTNLAFYNKYYNYGFNPIVCAQENLTNYTVVGNNTKDGVATVLLKEPDLGSITVRVVDQGGLKIDGITCPGDRGKAEPHPSDN